MAELSWFVFSLTATFLIGISMALYKLPSVKNQSRYVTAFWMLSIATLWSIIFFHSYLNLTSIGMVVAGSLFGVSFGSLMLFQMYALKHVNTNALYPVTSTLVLVLAVITGFLFFKDATSGVQFLGILLVVGVVYSYLYKGKKLQYSKQLLWVGAVIIFLGYFGRIVQKFAADNFDIHAYQIFQYSSAAIFVFLVILFVHRGEIKKSFTKQSFKNGCLMGTVSFFGGYALLIALTKGPFVLVTSIHTLYMFVTALVGAFLFKEKLTRRILLLIGLAVVALIIIRLG